MPPLRRSAPAPPNAMGARMDKPGRKCGVAAAVLLALAVSAEPIAAQGERQGLPDAAGRDPAAPTDAPRDVPNLELSQSQKETIYQSISNRQAKKDTAPVGFRAAVGARV